jgi:PAS domain S-box-containing protein
MLSNVRSLPPFRRMLQWPVLTLALLGPMVGMATYSAARNQERGTAQATLRMELRHRAFDLSDNVAGASAAVASAAALFAASETVTRAEFSTFCASILTHHPYIAAFEWIPQVPVAERERFELEVTNATASPYRIWQSPGAGSPVTVADAPAYFPVTYVEPLEGNETALGFDLASDRSRAAALVLAVATGAPALTDPIRQVQRAGAASGLLLVAPAFGGPAGADGDRRPQLRGFAVAVLRVGDLVERSFPGGLRTAPTRMSLELADDRADGGPVVMYRTPAADASSVSGAGSFRERIDLAGQRWSLTGRPIAARLAALRSGQPLLNGLAAFLGIELLLGLGFLAAKRARDRDALREADLIHTVLHSIADGVAVADSDGKILISNAAARRVFGDRSRVPPRSEWATAYGLYLPDTESLYPAEELPLARAIRGEAVPETEVYVRNRQLPDGAWFSVSGAPLKSRLGELSGGVIVFRDVTSHKRADELSQRLSNAVEQTADGVFITDHEGVIEYVNPAFERTTGYGRAEAVGQTPRILRSGKQSPDYYATLWSTIRAGEAFKATVHNRKKSGELFVAEQTITPMRNGSNGRVTHFVSVLRDMTERIQLQEREVEMRFASSVQQRLFPQQPPRIEGYDIAGAVSPALATCGDYFDFITLPDGALAVAVADVCGHGVGSALIMATTRAFLRSLTRARHGAGEILTEINTNLLDDIDEGLFVTMVLAVLDTRSGVVRWANAGHPTGHVIDSNGALKATLKSTGTILGTFPNLAFADGPPFTLEPGDLMVLLTDGVVEATSPEDCQFGAGAALEVVREYRDRPAEEIVGRVLEAARAFREGQAQEDDLTVVVCKRNRAA